MTFSGRFYDVKNLTLPQRAAAPPLLIGGGGPKMLAFAARTADVVGILPAPNRKPDDDDGAADRQPAAFERKVDVLREAAGAERFTQLELCAFVTIMITDSKRVVTEELIAGSGWEGITVEDVWSMPTMIIGSLDEIPDLIAERNARFGLSYLVCADADLDVVTRVIERL